MSKCTGKNQQIVQGRNKTLTSCMLGVRVASLGQLLDLRILDFVDQILVLLKSFTAGCVSSFHRFRIF